VRIGLDARALVSPVRFGVERYVVNLLLALAELEEGPEILAYVDRPVVDADLGRALSGRAETKLLRARRGWLRAALPWRLWRDGVDLVHLPSTILPPLLPCPAVVTVHDLAWARHPETYDSDDLRMQTEVVPRSVRRAAHVIAVSESTANDLTEVVGVPREKISVVPLGVSSVFRPDGPPLSRDIFPGAERLSGGYVLHTGGLHLRKNVARLLEAYKSVKEELAVPPLVIAGEATSAPGRRLRERAEALGVADDVIFAGYVEESVLAALYRGATVAVYASLYEGFGLPVLEAMASGVPVITSSRSAMVEVAGEAALLVDPESVEEIASALARLLGDEALRKELAARGMSRSRGYRWELTARGTVAAYRRVLEEA